MSILPGYAIRVGSKMAFDKVAELVVAPSSAENDADLKIVAQSLVEAYPNSSETEKAVEEIKVKRPDIAGQIFSIS